MQFLALSEQNEDSCCNIVRNLNRMFRGSSGGNFGTWRDQAFIGNFKRKICHSEKVFEDPFNFLYAENSSGKLKKLLEK